MELLWLIKLLAYAVERMLCERAYPVFCSGTIPLLRYSLRGAPRGALVAVSTS